MDYTYHVDVLPHETQVVQNFASVILKRLDEDRKGPQIFCDVTIDTVESTFVAHKCVIGLSSDFFKTMFTSKMKENYESKISISSLDTNTMEAVLGFMYSGQLCLNEENVYDVLSAAEFLQMYDLKVACSNHLRKNCSKENCLTMWRFARAFNLEVVAIVCELSISTNFNDVLQHKNFKELPIEDFELFFALRPTKISEEDIYHSVIAWAKHNETNYSDNTEDIFKCINFKKLTKKFLKTVVLNEKVVMQFKGCSTQVMDLTDDLTHNDVNSSHSLIILGGWPGEKEVSSYDVVTHYVTKLPNLPLRHSWACSVVANNILYVIGGHSKGLSKSYRSMFNLAMNDRFLVSCSNWAPSVPMIHCRRNAGCTALNNEIYVCGGKEHDTMWLNSCEYFSISKQQWFEISSMNAKRAEFGLVSLDGLLFAIGGCGKPDDFLDSLECYNVQNQVWTTLSPMKIPRAKFAAVVHHGEIYVIGGEGHINYLDSVEKYSPNTDTWCCVASLHQPRYNHVACVVAGKIYVYGGLPTVEVYDPIRNEWSLVDNVKMKLGCTMVSC